MIREESLINYLFFGSSLVTMKYPLSEGNLKIKRGPELNDINKLINFINKIY